MKIGAMELMVILLIAFLVLGPEKTVIYTRKLGKTLRTLKIYINSFTEDIRDTVAEPLAELQQPLEDLTKPLEEAARTVQAPVDSLNRIIRESESSLQKSLNARPEPKSAVKPSEPEELEEAIPVEKISK